MYCKHCGKPIPDGAPVCPECGKETGEQPRREESSGPTPSPKRTYCKNCGREVDPKAVVCPNCGAKLDPQDKKPVNGLGIAGFVLSIMSVWGGSVFVLPLVGLILSAIGVAKRKEYSASGFATAGLVISIVTLVFWIVFVVLVSVGIFTGFFDAFFDAINDGYPHGGYPY